MDQMKIKILEDGTISIDTDEISETNHCSADELIETINKMAGGEVKKNPKENKFWENRNVLKGGKIIENKW